ncbi:hypothetical protein CKJ84_00435 [Corynebacterium sp. NML 120412]|uniref:hypothetical protein n=1 Tax=Corynebacterium sp. NML 120412 TaxID=2029401 RepID=UPI000BAA92DF|nr:hypothetical protein [Corynebacterium sp. NML 120412]PAT14828.1 hypothetical protein CKJ84_00435 [Corynebacterium sp. NML 120412]
MKKKIASLVAAGLALVGAGTGATTTTANAAALPPNSTMGSSAASGALGFNAPAGTVVNQGDLISVFHGMWLDDCTLGYVDRGAGVGYTAGHCGFAGEPVLNANNQVIGYYENSHHLLPALDIPLSYLAQFFPAALQFASKGPLADVARIRFIPGVVPGANSFTGDRVAPIWEVQPGDQVCAVGAKSQQVFCGSVDKVNGDTTYAIHRGLRPGDSGGPAWIPGKGFIGVNSSLSENVAGTKGQRTAFAHPSAL